MLSVLSRSLSKSVSSGSVYGTDAIIRSDVVRLNLSRLAAVVVVSLVKRSAQLCNLSVLTVIDDTLASREFGDNQDECVSALQQLDIAIQPANFPAMHNNQFDALPAFLVPILAKNARATSQASYESTHVQHFITMCSTIPHCKYLRLFLDNIYDNTPFFLFLSAKCMTPEIATMLFETPQLRIGQQERWNVVGDMLYKNQFSEESFPQLLPFLEPPSHFQLNLLVHNTSIKLSMLLKLLAVVEHCKELPLDYFKDKPVAKASMGDPERLRTVLSLGSPMESKECMKVAFSDEFQLVYQKLSREGVQECVNILLSHGANPEHILESLRPEPYGTMFTQGLNIALKHGAVLTSAHVHAWFPPPWTLESPNYLYDFKQLTKTAYELITVWREDLALLCFDATAKVIRGSDSFGIYSLIKQVRKKRAMVLLSGHNRGCGRDSSLNSLSPGAIRDLANFIAFSPFSYAIHPNYLANVFPGVRH
ncbi:hypothetical protein Pelo_16004 [Pelomyxa schiedti]|nr:hypothetical protein Pelo_16004 [Pelomyxa schiedti]